MRQARRHDNTRNSSIKKLSKMTAASLPVLVCSVGQLGAKITTWDLLYITCVYNYTDSQNDKKRWYLVEDPKLIPTIRAENPYFFQHDMAQI